MGMEPSDSQTVTICTNFQPSFEIRLHMKFEEIWPRGFSGELVQRCHGWTDKRWTGSDHNSSF